MMGCFEQFSFQNPLVLVYEKDNLKRIEGWRYYEKYV